MTRALGITECLGRSRAFGITEYLGGPREFVPWKDQGVCVCERNQGGGPLKKECWVGPGHK